MSEKRKGSHKPMLAPESQTHRRRERAKQLSAIKRDGALAKRRRSLEPSSVAMAADEEAPSTAAAEYTEAELKEALAGLAGPPAGALPHLAALRKMLSSEEDPPIQAVIDAGAVPRLLALLEHPDDRYKLDAVRCIANIGSGDRHATSHVLDAAPALIALLHAPSPALVEDALWALGNIAGDVQTSRDVLSAQGAVPAITRVLAAQTRHAATRSSAPLAAVAAWALGNLARGEGASALPFGASGAFAPLVALLGVAPGAGERGENAAAEAAWALAFLTAREDACVEQLLGLGVVPALVDLLARGTQDHSSAKESAAAVAAMTPALRTLGNLAAGPDAWVAQLLSQPKFLPSLAQVVASQDPTHHAMVKEAAWLVSSLVGGHASCRDAVLAAGFLVPTLDLLRSGQFDLQREAARAVWNIVADAANSAGAQQALQAVTAEPGVLAAFVALLRVPDMETVAVALSYVRLVCERVPEGSRAVERAGGLEAIDELHYGPVDPAISAQAAAIVDKFFGEDYEEDSTAQPAAPAPADIGHGMGRGKHLTEPAWMHK
ncbi:importin alpha [Tribonema minus]|uniref:Importin subunit alpha n=1 Tax=Tribonema minus TaxID=303371 RepID=A0A835YTV7_9STRA|nr:importin alpha [Tribonema minus]